MNGIFFVNWSIRRLFLLRSNAVESEVNDDTESLLRQKENEVRLEQSLDDCGII
jgi:hypothetical protein